MAIMARNVPPVSLMRMMLGLLLQPGLFALFLFAPAGTWAWWRAWVIVGVVFVAALVSLVTLAWLSPALLAERFGKPIQEGQPFADKVILIAYLTAFAGLIAFIPVDVFHLRLFAVPAPWVSAVGLALFVAGWWLAIVALRANAFAAPVVKAMRERGQSVVDTGVYAIVRHPMYAGVALLLLGMALWLESYAAVLLAAFPIALLCGRILIEERFLRAALADYGTYAERVRFRLVPGVW
jgi:protein-S-isoprenylcysteine O-methyltransferase Ste14